jgi:hypothetical protein
VRRIKSYIEVERYVSSELTNILSQFGKVTSPISQESKLDARYTDVRKALNRLNEGWQKLQYLYFAQKALSYLERTIIMQNVEIFWNPKQLDKKDSPDIQIANATGHVILVAELILHVKDNEKAYLSEIKRKLKKLRKTGAKRIILFFHEENYDEEVGKYLQLETEIDVVKLKLNDD